MDELRIRLWMAGWRPLTEISNWRTAERLMLYHPEWGGIIGEVTPRDRYGLDVTTVWGYVVS